MIWVNEKTGASLAYTFEKVDRRLIRGFEG